MEGLFCLALVNFLLKRGISNSQLMVNKYDDEPCFQSYLNVNLPNH
jgi:hypothetical protein